MSPNEFDRSLMEDLSQLPPAPGEVESYTPWRAAMTKILWGMGLTTFRFEFFYLQYILPLLGAALLYLGYRSLRRENRWFRLCWVLSGILLAVHMATDILTATPVMGWITQNPALNWGLTWPLVGMQLLLLFALWRGTRAAFASVGEAEPRDWLKRGLVCYLLSLAIALWSELVPLTQDDGFFGPSILEQYEWLYYGRSIAFIALQIYLLVCIARQSGASPSSPYRSTFWCASPGRAELWPTGAMPLPLFPSASPQGPFCSAYLEPSCSPSPSAYGWAGASPPARRSPFPP